MYIYCFLLYVKGWMLNVGCFPFKLNCVCKIIVRRRTQQIFGDEDGINSIVHIV